MAYHFTNSYIIESLVLQLLMLLCNICLWGDRRVILPVMHISIWKSKPSKANLKSGSPYIGISIGKIRDIVVFTHLNLFYASFEGCSIALVYYVAVRTTCSNMLCFVFLTYKQPVKWLDRPWQRIFSSCAIFIRPPNLAFSDLWICSISRITNRSLTVIKPSDAKGKFHLANKACYIQALALSRHQSGIVSGLQQPLSGHIVSLWVEGFRDFRF